MKDPEFMKAPFPYFGGKSRVVDVVWKALGNPKHYMEPFFGSGAVLLGRPNYDPTVHLETICDKDGFVANAWRGMQFAPDEVAKYCDWPVNHVDLNARRKYLQDNQELLKKLAQDPEYFDAKIAGYWIWCMSSWIGSGLIRKDQMPNIGDSERGVNKTTLCKIPNIGGGKTGSRGVCKMSLCQIPYIAYGPQGIAKKALFENPDLNKDVQDPYTPKIYQWFRILSERLRRVRVVCGDWNRICGGNWQTFNNKVCGIFFDPPYSNKANRTDKLYNEDSLDVAHNVREWCKVKGKTPTYRIVLAGYYEEHEELLNEGWTVHKWKAGGGYAATGNGDTNGKANCHKEALFFSPHCLKLDQQTIC